MTRSAEENAMPGAPDLIQVVSELGFTSLEAEIYVYLLQYSPATGYRIAKDIGRSFAITYKALAALEGKGAVVVDGGASRSSRAVPIEELLDQVESRLREQRARAVAAVRDFPKSAGDDRVYQLTTIEQVYERCRAMLRDSRGRVLMELFPEPLETLRDAIEKAAARGVDVTARIYKPAELEGVRIVMSPYGDENLRVMKSQWLALFVDGRQFLLGNLVPGAKGVYQVIWSASRLLALAFYDYVNSDLHHYSFQPFLRTADSIEDLRAEYDRLQTAFPIWAGQEWSRLLGIDEEQEPEDTPVQKGESHDEGSQM
jgi:sugar-specific transcriptional regulator TrmB